MRQLFLLISTVYLITACTTTPESQGVFQHGVASGDPLSDAVIIWTRVTVENQPEVEVAWEVSTDEAFTTTIKNGTALAIADRDFTVKVDITDLEADTYYYYRFKVGDEVSTIGRTKTASTIASKVRLAVVSCSNYEAGYFNSFATLALQPEIDAVLHLGDYIYEYEPDKYGDTTLDRKHLPAKEIVTLSEYNTRYGQYRKDADLQKVHQMHPFIVVWDDHEISNNANIINAENHQAHEGDYKSRTAAAKKAYYNWMPIRESKTLYRKFDFGNKVDLIMLDERLEGRSEQIYTEEEGDYTDPNRTMLGEAQFNWLTNHLSDTTSQWKVIGNQVMFANFDLKSVRPKEPLNMDAWDGYPAERSKLVNYIADNKIDNIIFVTGDTHCSWAFDIPKVTDTYDAETANNSIAVELGTPGLTSSNYDAYYPLDTVKVIEGKYQNDNPHLQYVNLHKQGYFILTLDDDVAQADYYYMDKINEPSKGESLGKTVIVKNLSNKLIIQ